MLTTGHFFLIDFCVLSCSDAFFGDYFGGGILEGERKSEHKFRWVGRCGRYEKKSGRGNNVIKMRYGKMFLT